MAAMIGNGGQIIFGVLADRFEHRPLILGGLLLTVGCWSLAALIAHSLPRLDRIYPETIK